MSNTQARQGITFAELLLLLFIGLKLGGVITWSWWWVMSPLWIPVAILLAILGLIGVVVLVDKATRWLR